MDIRGEWSIPNAKEFSVAFACAVTKPTMNQLDCIAKNGDESVFALMCTVFPMVCSRIIQPFHCFLINRKIANQNGYHFVFFKFQILLRSNCYIHPRCAI